LTQVICPKCDFEQPASAECVRCGVLVSKAGRAGRSRGPAIPEIFDGRIVAPSTVSIDHVGDGQISKKELLILGGGLCAAIAIYALPLTRGIFSILKTLFHEFSHAAVGWVLGHPSLPSFDFVYGGGWTHQAAFRPSIAVAIGAGMAWLVWHFRENRRSTIIAGTVAAIWLIVVTAEWRRETAVAIAGHLGEFVLAGIFLYKALSGVGLRQRDVERPLAAFAAFFVQLSTTVFAWRLTRDADYLAMYLAGKDGGGGFMNDLETVALNIQIQTGISLGTEGVARLLMLFSPLPFVIALLWYLKRAHWHSFLRALRTADA
jgi:hypothetical protein